MLLIFGLDYTLTYNDHEDHECLFPETVSILSYLVSKNHVLAIATHNSNVYSILEQNHIEHFFNPDLIIGFDDISKIPHLNMIMKIANESPNECFFFDDLLYHVNEAKKIGISSYSLDVTHGMKLKDIKTIMNLHYILNYKPLYENLTVDIVDVVNLFM
jgi:FMN phosphatase YigB (HAD superfamily)